MIKPYVYDGGLLTAAATVQGAVVPTLTTRLIKAGSIVNTTAAAVSVTVYLVPSGGTPNAASTIISARPIAPGETYNFDFGPQGINAGGSVQALGLGLTFKYTALDFI